MIKAVITAAGKGTRLLPATKELPKEMMPIFASNNKEKVVVPLLQFVFEQLFSLNVRDYCFVVGREKRSIEDHFAPHESYLKELPIKYRSLISNFYNKLEKSHLVWINQNKPLGFGDAVKKAEKYVGLDNFIVHAGDVSIIGRAKHPILRMIEIAKRDPSIDAVLLCKKVNDPYRYGVPEMRKISSSAYKVLSVEEKPTKPKSNFGLLPIYFFKPNIFNYLKKIKPGKNNEFQLTDAIQKLLQNNGKITAIPLYHNEFEIDVGTVESYRYSQQISYNKAVTFPI